MQMVPPPDDKGRLEILKIYTNRMPISNNVNLEQLSKDIEGFSGADIEAWCREAAMIALRENMRARVVSIEHFKEAKKEVHPSITPEIIKWYQEFGEKLKLRTIQDSKEERLFV